MDLVLSLRSWVLGLWTWRSLDSDVFGLRLSFLVLSFCSTSHSPQASAWGQAITSSSRNRFNGFQNPAAPRETVKTVQSFFVVLGPRLKPGVNEKLTRRKPQTKTKPKPKHKNTKTKNQRPKTLPLYDSRFTIYDSPPVLP